MSDFRVNDVTPYPKLRNALRKLLRIKELTMCHSSTRKTLYKYFEPQSVQTVWCSRCTMQKVMTIRVVVAIRADGVDR